MARVWATLLAVSATVGSFAGQTGAVGEQLLARHYTDGARLRYRMTAENNGSSYAVTITSITKKTEEGRFIDEFAWSDMVVNGTGRVLQPASQAFRIAVTLDGGAPFAPPDLSKAPGLVGPVTDLLNFYADLFLAMHRGVLRQAGDRFYFPNPMPASWADGATVVLGEDHIDFDIALTAVDRVSGEAMLSVKHVPARTPRIRLPAEWMHASVADTPNNWVQVQKTATGFAASVGKETFDVTLSVSIADGTIRTAALDNPVTMMTRRCSDIALSQCDEPRANRILRRVEMKLLREP